MKLARLALLGIAILNPSVLMAEDVTDVSPVAGLCSEGTPSSGGADRPASGEGNKGATRFTFAVRVGAPDVAGIRGGVRIGHRFEVGLETSYWTTMSYEAPDAEGTRDHAGMGTLFAAIHPLPGAVAGRFYVTAQVAGFITTTRGLEYPWLGPGVGYRQPLGSTERWFAFVEVVALWKMDDPEILPFPFARLGLGLTL